MAKKTPHSAPTNAIIYLRVSTAGQAESGAGIEAQESACRAHAARLGLPIRAVYRDEGISGKKGSDKRPGLAATIDHVRSHPGTVVIVYSLSRLARSQRLLWEMIDPSGIGLPISSATEPFDISTATGRAMLGMLSVFAALESDMASERTRDALAAVRARGTRLGAPRLVDRAPETAARVRAMYASGDYSHASLAAALNAAGVPTARGGRWHATSVRLTLAQAS